MKPDLFLCVVLGVVCWVLVFVGVGPSGSPLAQDPPLPHGPPLRRTALNFALFVPSLSSR